MGLLGLSLLSLCTRPAAAAPNCVNDFIVSPPSCLTQEDAAAECAFEGLYDTRDDPRIFQIGLSVETGDGQFADTEGAVWVRLDDERKIFLNSPKDDFEHGDYQTFELVGTGVERLSDIHRLEIGNDSSDHWAIRGVELSLNGVRVYETPADFEEVVGSGGSRWWAPVDMNLAGQSADIAVLPSSLGAKKVLELALGNLFRSLPGANTDWNTGHADSDGVFEFWVDPADDTHAMFSGYGVARSDEADVYVDFSGDIRVSCEAGVFAMVPGELGFDVTSVDVHGYWNDLGSAFINPEAEAQDAIDDRTAQINALLGAQRVEIPIGPILDELELHLEDHEREFVLNALCPQPRFQGTDLLFSWPDPLVSASVRMELGDEPQPVVCEPPPFDPFGWDPDPDLDVDPFGGFEFHPNLVVDAIVDQGDGTIAVTVRNAGVVGSSQTWIDVFFERQTAPSVGEYGDVYASVPALDMGESYVATLDKLGSGWVDAIVDTTQSVEESNEDDNWLDELIW